MTLKRELNLLDVFCIASGAMISSGLFVLPGLAHARAGPAVILSYLLAGLLAVAGMLSQAELVSAMPKAGGTYYYVTRSLGPAVGAVDGLITWFSLSLKSAFALVGMAAFARVYFELASGSIHYLAAGFCVLFVLFNLAGVKHAGRVQVIIVLGLIGLLLFYFLRGAGEVNVGHFEPFAPYGAGSVVATAGFVFISFGGLLKVASIAEEIKRPSRTVPLAMILSLLAVCVLYTLVIFVTVGVLPGADLDKSLTPISDGAGVFLGPWGKMVLSFAALLAFISTANAGIMASSRYPLALSRDGMMPRLLGKVSKRFNTPHYAILLTGALIALSLFLNLEVLIKAASSVLILSYLFPCLCVILLREGRVQNYLPGFRAPLYPWLQIVGLVGFSAMLFQMGTEALIVICLMVIGGFLLYRFSGRAGEVKEYALLHLVERITAKELTSRSLETELKEIIRERDDIVVDRLDRMIEDCLVMDIEGGVGIDRLFRLVAESLSERIDEPQDAIFEKLMEREKESTTVISPTIAVPHIILEGEGKFGIALVRCRKGAAFNEEATNVQAVFVLAGTRDERNFHLRALTAIAQICQNPKFEARWMKADSTEDLRDLMLLGSRRRSE